MPGLRFRLCDTDTDGDDVLVVAWKTGRRGTGRLGLSCYLNGGAVPVSPARVFDLGANEADLCRRASDGTLGVAETDEILRSPRRRRPTLEPATVRLRSAGDGETTVFACDP